MSRLFQRIKISILFLAFAITGMISIKVYAEDEFSTGFTQTEYTEEDGFASGQANCICQSVSGYIWIGTDSGLYRYDGSEFLLYSLDGETDGSNYCINKIITTSTGALYVGTENYGLYLYNNGSFERVVDTYNMGIGNVKDMCEDQDGNIWIATSSEIYKLCADGGVDEILADMDTEYDIGAIASYGNNIYAIGNNDTFINIIDGSIVITLTKTDYMLSDDLNSLYIDPDGTRYYGTMGHSVLKITNTNEYEIIGTGALSGINKIFNDGSRNWFLSDTGVAYIDSEGLFNYMSGLAINDSMSDMLIDYEGNYWFTSSRKGLLFLGHSKFINYTGTYKLGESIVNCIIEYNNQIYIGTDDGLTIVDRNGETVTESELVNSLSGISIRQMYVDSSNYLWICTYKIYGVVKLSSTGLYKYYNRSDSGLISNFVNCITELSDGSMAVGTESGISIITDGKVVRNYTRNDGLENTDIISLYQDDTGILYAGTNGSGMCSIDIDANIKQISTADGITSNVVSSITGGTNGLWIGTDNGLFYQEGVIRQISAIDPSYSICDIILDNDGYLWLISSRGIQKYYENDLLSEAEPEGEIYTRYDGLGSAITDNSKNYITDEGLVYLCCEEGLYALDTSNIYVNEIPPKVRISSVIVDGVEYAFSDLNGYIKVSENASRIIIKFSVLSYVNRNGIQVNYYLNGFETENITLSGTDIMEAEYTNLEGGTYEFVLSAENADGVKCDESLSFTIEKELKFSETSTAKALIVIIVVFVLMVIGIVSRMIFRSMKNKSAQVEELSKKSAQVEKSNQAKNYYVNYLGNEIRAPLNSILANCEMLLRSVNEQNEEQVEKLSDMYENSYAILNMVDGINRLTKYKDGEIELDIKEYAVSDFIADLTPILKGKINHELVQLKVSIEDDIPNGLIGDRLKVKEIITSIFDRAASTTKEGIISINVDWRQPNQEEDVIYLDFVISDTGVGIREDRVENLFDLYDSYDKEDMGQFDIRIKLATARELIKLMGGDVSVSSIYGAGTTVKFSIKQEVFNYEYVNFNSERIKELSFMDSKSRIWLPDVRVLIVDDIDATLQVAKILLDTYELKADTAVSGFEAIDKVMVSSYDMIFINTLMHVMDGSDTLREIRSLDGEEYKKVPVIAMASNIIDGSRDEILNKGFNEVIVKPIEVTELEAMFRLFLPADKIKEKTNNIEEYINQSRYKDDIKILARYIAVENAIKMMGGSFDAFNKVIVSYKKEYETELNSLEQYIEDDVRHFRNVIHDIKSSSGNIAAFSVERKAANLESAINIGNLQYARENIKDFVALMKDMFKDIDRYIARINDQPEPEGKEFKDNINRAILKEMRAYMRDADEQPVKALLSEIEKYDYPESDMEFFTALKMIIADMDFQAGSEIIDQYLNSK